MITLPTALSDMKDSSSVFFVDLYRLVLPTGTNYYAACDKEINWYIPDTTTAVTYEAIPIERGSFKQSTSSKIDNLDIKISDVTETFATALLQSYDFTGYDVDIFQIAYPDSLTDSSSYKYVFHGYIDAPVLDYSTSTFTATLKVKTNTQYAGRTCMLSCGAWFGDDVECGAEQVTQEGTVGSGSTQYIIYDSSLTQAASYWKNGTVTYGFETKRILSSAVGSITVEYPFYTTPTEGDSYSCETGCDGSTTDCDRHSNRKNYNGMLAIPWQYSVKT